ncbi:hypothetical protein MTBBW1_2500029 [Desulfamplus magnetovallimortis]|uniref:Uncharacterized protein n=1 Tax=Desulfamplus magnetovallimortis TaxID=1246637 RepID=A0A1W1HEI5_9BACT|nr:hypothetical protein [Desulfamplus magnetovallimortis]SLM30880.1 hypothetical protein MTBBW1_2500029 [Desulfamplus magnetovallimortis]
MTLLGRLDNNNLMEGDSMKEGLKVSQTEKMTQTHGSDSLKMGKIEQKVEMKQASTEKDGEGRESSERISGVDKFVLHLKKIGSQQKKDKLETGKIFITEVYGGNYKDAEEKAFTKGKDGSSIAKVIEKIEKDPSNEYPSKTWIYDAINLAIDYKKYENGKIDSTYGNLKVSHQTALTSVNDVEDKNKLIKDSVEKNWSVAELKKQIKELKAEGIVNVLNLSLTQEIDQASLEKSSAYDLKKYIGKAKEKQKKIIGELELIAKNIQAVESEFKKKKKDQNVGLFAEN